MIVLSIIPFALSLAWLIAESVIAFREARTYGIDIDVKYIPIPTVYTGLTFTGMLICIFP